MTRRLARVRTGLLCCSRLILATTPLPGLVADSDAASTPVVPNLSGTNITAPAESGGAAPDIGSMTSPASLPQVQTLSPTNISSHTALLRGWLTDDGNDPASVFFFYGTIDEGTNLVAWQHNVSLGVQTGLCSSLESGLDEDARYYVRAYAQNAAGGSWASNTFSFATAPAQLATVVINEIHYDPEFNSKAREFIEILNAGTQTIDLSGWEFTRGVDFDFPLGSTMSPGQYLIIAQDANEFSSVFGFMPFGQWEAGDRLDNDGETVTLRDGANDKVDEVDYGLAFPWPTASQGEGSSMELIHPGIDNDLGGAWRASAGGPTPGVQNSVNSLSIPPRLRQVKHDPAMPVAGQSATITVKATDPDGIQDVKLFYQVVQPGSYIPSFLAKDTPGLLANPSYPLAPNPVFSSPTNWTEVAMVDDGSGESRFTVTLPAQENRVLVRYRIEAVDLLGDTVLVPYADDPSLNFAYFTYKGVPAYTAEERTVQRAGAPYTYPTNVMRSLPVYFLITDPADFGQCIAYSSSDQIPRGNFDARSTFNWTGTFIYEAKVYDHIGYRLRQRNGRYAGSGKRSMRFRFNKGHYVQFHDLEGREYPRKWRTLNTQKCRGSRGNYNFGMVEIASEILFNVFNVPAPRAHWMHFRVIKGPDEAPAGADGQHLGDFFGYYEAMEDFDVRFLEAHDLEKGNLYKLKSTLTEGTEIQRYQALDAVDDGSDFENIIYNLRPSSTDAWLDQHVDYAHWNRYHTVIEAIRSFDVKPNLDEHLKNRAFYFKPTPGTPMGRLQTLPWDTDTSWGPNWNEGEDFAKQAIFDPMRPEYLLRYRNTVRDFRDLLYQPDQINILLARLGEQLEAFVPADRDRWRNSPLSEGNEDSGEMWPKLANMKKFAWVGGTWAGETANTQRPNGTDDHLDGLAVDSDIPDTPTITYTGMSGFPVNALSFSCSSFADPQGAGTFDAMEWRIGQIYNTNAPNHDFTKLMIFEYDLIWGSGTLPNFVDAITVPAGALEQGLTYRARVRFRDNTERWSHWSAPVEFTTTEHSGLSALTNNLRITEVMYNAPTGSDYDYIELHNASSNFPLVLDGVTLDDAISYTFPAGTVLGEGQYLVVAKLPGMTFDTYYGTEGLTVLGPYSGNLSNGGEEIEVEAPGGGGAFIRFQYSDARGWPLAADGAGHSLVPLLLKSQQGDGLSHPINWRASAYMRGSPGEDDPLPPAGIVINEFAAHTDFSDLSYPDHDSDDWVELFNPESFPVILNDYFLSDDPAELKKWAMPAQVLNLGEWVSYSEVFDFHNPITTGFGLDKAGEQIFLSYLPGTAQDRVVDSILFRGQENGRTWGRFRDGEAYWYDMPPTRDAANQLQGPPPVVISEVMFAPAGTDALEYIELYNPTATSVALWNSNGAWRLNGGVDFDFPSGTMMASDTYLVVVPSAPADVALLNDFLTAYGLSNGQVNIMGPYSGKLSDTGERITLEKPQAPDIPDIEISWVIVDEVHYYRASPWPPSGTGSGFSLHRIADDVSGYSPINWLAFTASPGVIFDPVVLSGLRVPPDALRLFWTAEAGAAYVIEMSEDLFSDPWQQVGTMTGNGTVTFDDIPPTGVDRRYYRLLQVD